MADGGGFPARKLRGHGSQEHAGGGDLDAAGRTGRATTDKHQNIGAHQCNGMGLTIIDGIKARRARGRAGKERVEQLIPERHGG